jgi:protocatechuate 3,4-dioxygenase, beta subunit
MKNIIGVLLIVVFNHASCQEKKDQRAPGEKVVGGRCEGCEAIYEYGSKKLAPVDTLPDFFENGRKLEITGTIYHKDGKTPAGDVILYIYHTDQTGVYPTKGNEQGWAKRHGYIRGWIRTNQDGKYKFYTLMPGAYPTGDNPAHIHPTIKEPGYREYWIDEFLFDDDPILTKKHRSSQQQRGGNGIVQPVKKSGNMLTVKRDIILGLNVPGYE